MATLIPTPVNSSPDGSVTSQTDFFAIELSVPRGVRGENRSMHSLQDHRVRRVAIADFRVHSIMIEKSALYAPAEREGTRGYKEMPSIFADQ